MPVELETFFDGDWPGIKKALHWLQRKSQNALEKALREEANVLKRALKQQLYKGGSPAFRPLSPFSVAIRKAMGVRGRKPLLATRQLVRSIKHKRTGRLEYFAGVPHNVPHRRRDGSTTKASEVALLVEEGRGPVVLWLDKPSPRTGKTPRQWLWWLYLEGVLSAPPSPNKNVMILRGSEARPFIRQTWEKEAKQSGERIRAAWVEMLEKEVGGPGAHTLLEWDAVKRGNPWEG